VHETLASACIILPSIQFPVFGQSANSERCEWANENRMMEGSRAGERNNEEGFTLQPLDPCSPMRRACWTGCFGPSPAACWRSRCRVSVLRWSDDRTCVPPLDGPGAFARIETDIETEKEISLYSLCNFIYLTVSGNEYFAFAKAVRYRYDAIARVEKCRKNWSVTSLGRCEKKRGQYLKVSMLQHIVRSHPVQNELRLVCDSHYVILHRVR